MSIAGILSSGLYAYNSVFGQNSTQASPQQQTFQQEFQQLGQDLQSGNLAAAQADFASLQPSGGQQAGTLNAATASSTQGSNPVAQEFSQLSQDLKSGNLSAAQQDFNTLKQDLQAAQGHGRYHHHHHVGSGNSSSSINQVMGQLSQALQSGNLSSAQQAYSTLQEDFQAFAQSNGLGSATSSGSVSVNA